MKHIRRRQFLGASGAVLGAAAAGGLGTLLLGKPAALAAPVDASLSMGAIFFVLNGGARTQSMFNGRVGLGTNPFGQLTGMPVELTGIMQGTGLDDPLINKHLNLVATAQHHNRTGNHSTGRTVACTGYTEDEGKAGILTLVNYNFGFREIPCVNIGNDTPATNVGTEVPATFAPMKISNANSIGNITDAFESIQVSTGERVRQEALRYQLEDRFHRQTKYAEPEVIPFFQRRAAEIAELLNGDALDINVGNAAMGSYIDTGNAVTNTSLRTLFGNGNLGESAMLAVRLRQVGCAGIALSSGNFDMHSNELNNMPGRGGAVGSALAGLIAALSNIADPYDDTRTLLDTTVITVMTDFGRGNWGVGSGFNGNNGSDHQSNNDKTSYQCIPIIGGGLPGSTVLGEVDGSGSPVAGSPEYGTRQILSTVLDLMGVPAEQFYPGATPLTAELIA